MPSVELFRSVTVKERRIFELTVGAFALLALWPVLTTELLPMQDYPRHLYHAQLMHADRWPELDYGSYYTAHLIPGPYVTFYWLVGLLSYAVPLELAGRLVVASIVLMVAGFVLSEGRRTAPGEAGPPWGLLLLFPLTCNAFWFLGFVNYLLTLPMLLFALRERQRLAAGPRPGVVFRLVFWLAAIFFTHPYALLVYIVFDSVWGLLPASKSAPGEDSESPGTGRRGHLAGLGIRAGFTFLVFAWAAYQFSGGGPAGRLRWLPLGRTLRFGLGVFTGFGRGDGIDVLALVPWLAILTLCAVVRWRQGRAAAAGPRGRLSLFLLLSAAGFLILPFSPLNYFNLRLAGPIYLLLGLLAGTLRFGPRARVALVLLAAAVLGRSVSVQLALSREKAELVPLLEQMRPNARLLPLVFDNDSDLLDRRSFDPHLHDYCYYHLRVGGGFSPYLWRGLAGIQQPSIRPEAARPAPGEYRAGSFRIEQHAADYDYFLARSPPPELEPYLAPIAEPLGRSGRWALFARRKGEG